MCVGERRCRACAARSNSEARRLIQQGVVKVNEIAAKNIDEELTYDAGDYVLRVGKKQFIKIVPKK